MHFQFKVSKLWHSITHYFVRRKVLQSAVNLLHPLCFLSDEFIRPSVIAFYNTAPMVFLGLLHKNHFQTEKKNAQLKRNVSMLHKLIYIKTQSLKTVPRVEMLSKLKIQTS